MVTRFGHTATAKSDGSIVLTGGFGLENGKHMRLNGVHLLHTVQGNILLYKLAEKEMPRDGCALIKLITILSRRSVALYRSDSCLGK